MANCRDVEANLTAYVDGECVEQATLQAHLAECPRCRARVGAERSAHELLRSRCRVLRGSAPAALRHRCLAQRTLARVQPSLLVRRPLMSLSLAATVLVAASVVLLFALGSSVKTYAAQLAADHVKCFTFPPEAAAVDIAAVGRDWLQANGWPLRIPPSSPADGLQLVGLRRCGSSKGRLAHVLYRWRGQPLSVYVLNGRIAAGGALGHDGPGQHVLRTLGAQEIIWSDKGRTYAVVGDAPLAELQRVATHVRRRIE